MLTFYICSLVAILVVKLFLVIWNNQGSLAGVKHRDQDCSDYANTERRSMMNDNVTAAAVAAERITQNLDRTPSTEEGIQHQSDHVYSTEIGIPDHLVGLRNMANIQQYGNSLLLPTLQTAIIEILIPGSKAGLVIGKNGETIKHLQEENNVKMVLIQQSSTPTNEDKPLRISGDPSSVEYVKQQVLDIINAGEATKYAVPADKVGLVIGKGGETIKEINRVSGAHVEISKDPSPEESIKIFNIRGSRNKIEVAIRMISERAGMPLPRLGGARYQLDHSSIQVFPAPIYNPCTGQLDFSAAWAEYYRRLGMHGYADAILRRAPLPHMGVSTMPTMPGIPGPQDVPAHATAAQQAVAAQHDYNQWWQWQVSQQIWQQPIPQQPVGMTGIQSSVIVPSAMPTAQYT